MIFENVNILLGYGAKADCLLFKDALKELTIFAMFTIVCKGEQLIEEISKIGSKFSDVLFLKLNMPSIIGFASLGEIKHNTDLLNLPFIIFSTASDVETVKNVFRNAARNYIIKLPDFRN